MPRPSHKPDMFIRQSGTGTFNQSVDKNLISQYSTHGCVSWSRHPTFSDPGFLKRGEHLAGDECDEEEGNEQKTSSGGTCERSPTQLAGIRGDLLRRPCRPDRDTKLENYSHSFESKTQRAKKKRCFVLGSSAGIRPLMGAFVFDNCLKAQQIIPIGLVTAGSGFCPCGCMQTCCSTLKLAILGDYRCRDKYTGK